MSADDLFERLAQAEAELLRQRDPEWDEVARGRLTVAEAKRRLAEARSVDAAELARAGELFEPPAAEFDEALVDRLVELTAIDEPSPSEAVVIEREDVKWWRRRGAVALLSAVAAAAAVVLLWPRFRGPQAVVETDVGLPPHELWIVGEAMVRGAEDANVPKFEPGSTLTIGVRPLQRHGITPEVAVCLSGPDDVRPLPARPRIGRPGEAFEIEATLPERLAAGRWQIVVLLAGQRLSDSERSDCETDRDGARRLVSPFDVR